MSRLAAGAGALPGLCTLASPVCSPGGWGALPPLALPLPRVPPAVWSLRSIPITAPRAVCSPCPFPVWASGGGDTLQSSEDTPQRTAPVPVTSSQPSLHRASVLLSSGPGRPSAQVSAAPSCPRVPSKGTYPAALPLTVEGPPAPVLPAPPDCLVLFSVRRPWEGGVLWCPARRAGPGGSVPPPGIALLSQWEAGWHCHRGPWLLQALSRPTSGGHFTSGRYGCLSWWHIGRISTFSAQTLCLPGGLCH